MYCSPCPLWVKSRHHKPFGPCPLYPRKRASRSAAPYPLSAKSAHDAFLRHGNWHSLGVARAHTMKLPRRKFLHLAATAVVVPGASRVAWAQSYPTGTVRLIVGFAAGGAPDILARLIGQWLSERLGQSFVVENKPGAGGNLATEE